MMLLGKNLLSNKAENAFIFRVTVSNGDVFTLPLTNGVTYSFTVDFGDGSGKKLVTAYNDLDATQTYVAAGTYEIEIAGNCPSFKVDNNAAIDTKITKVVQWGEIGLTELNFNGCSNLTITAEDTLDTSGMTSFLNLFKYCTSITTVPFIDNWNTSTITNMTGVFFGCYNFNQDLNNWDVSNVIGFFDMFVLAYKFNGNISNWNTSSAVNFGDMFKKAYVFNSDISAWDVSKATSFYRMFNYAYAFNQPIGIWNTTMLLNVYETFYKANKFNQSLDNWDVSSVTNFFRCFQQTDYNQPLNSWDMLGVTNTQLMFYLSDFNEPLTDWDTSTITNMADMFNTCPYDQDMSNWDFSEVISWGSKFASNLSTINYDKLLVAIDNTSAKLNLNLTVTSTYTFGSTAEIARNSLIAKGWTITDNGGI